MKCLKNCFNCPYHRWSSSKYIYCEDTSSMYSGEHWCQGSHPSVPCILCFLSGTARANALTWDWTAAGNSTDMRQLLPLRKGRQNNQSPSQCAARSQCLERDRIRGHFTKSQYSQGCRERLLRWSPGRGQAWVPKTNSGVGTRPWEAAAAGPDVINVALPVPAPRFSELIKGNGTSPGSRASLQQLTVTITYASLY